MNHKYSKIAIKNTSSNTLLNDSSYASIDEPVIKGKKNNHYSSDTVSILPIKKNKPNISIDSEPSK